MKNLTDIDYKKAENFVSTAQLSYQVNKYKDRKSKNEVLKLVNAIYGNVNSFYPILYSFNALKNADKLMNYHLQLILEKVKDRKITKKEIYLKCRNLHWSSSCFTLGIQVHWYASIPCETKYSLEEYHKIPLVLEKFKDFLDEEVKTKKGQFGCFFSSSFNNFGTYFWSQEKKNLKEFCNLDMQSLWEKFVLSCQN